MNVYKLLICIAIIIASCDISKLSQTPMSKFIGVWRVEDHSILNNCELIISYKSKSLKGRLIKLNQNKLVNLFCDTNTIIISSIARKSNFQFIVKEKLIASELFSSYNISSEKNIEAEFKSENTIILKKSESKIPLFKLIRIKK